MAEGREELVRLRTNLAAQGAVARVLAQAPTLVEATPMLLEAIGDSLGWELGSLWTIDPREGLLRCQAVWQAQPGADEFERASLERPLSFGEGLPGRVWSGGRPEWIPDVLVDDNFPRAPVAARERLRAAFGFPIRNRDQILGVIEFFSREVRAVDEQTLELAETFGNQIGQYVRRKQAEDAVRHSEGRKAGILESALDAIVTIDHRGYVLDFNPAAEHAFGYASHEVIGKEMAELIVPPALRDRHRRALRRTVETGEGVLLGRRIELTGMRADGHEFPVELTITRIEGEDPPVFTGYLRDITERTRRELRAALLAEAGEDLTASLDLKTTLRAVAGLCVPGVAEWCVVDLLSDDRRLERMAVAHADPAKESLAWDLERRYRTDLGAAEGLPKAIRTGRSELLEDIPDELLEAVAQDDEHLELLRGLGIRSAMIVPLRARGRTLGGISFAAGESGRRFDSDDLAFAEELARRAALAIDNARIYEERSRIAETLQASLLPPRLPSVPGIAVASRFRAAGEAYRVGGDFFDLFATASGRWTIVMGDVSGKGPEAAGVTALARYTVREAAAHNDLPSSVLGRLNDAVLGHQEEGGEHFCTALVGRLDVAAGDVRLTLASGGHPLPLRLDTSGRVTPVGRAGMLLGMSAEPELSDAEIDLDPGDSVLLYTDGITETPTARGAFLGDAGLADLLRACRDLDAEALVDRIDRTVVELQAGDPRDDIAMVALRVQEAATAPEDGREAEALAALSPAAPQNG